jgi:hypothetical protein
MADPGQSVQVALRLIHELLTAGILVTSAPGDGAITAAGDTPVSVGSSTTAVLPANGNRVYALFVNDSDEVIYLRRGAAAVLNQGIRLNASGGSYEMSGKFGNLYTGAINAICASGGKNLLVDTGE